MNCEGCKFWRRAPPVRYREHRRVDKLTGFWFWSETSVSWEDYGPWLEAVQAWGKCQRFPKEEPTDAVYICGEFKSKTPGIVP